jgi:hypothetical protein
MKAFDNTLGSGSSPPPPSHPPTPHLPVERFVPRFLQSWWGIPGFVMQASSGSGGGSGMPAVGQDSSAPKPERSGKLRHSPSVF